MKSSPRRLKGVRLDLYQPLTGGVIDQCSPIVEVKLGHEVLPVPLHRVDA
jgi:hypothetical protein